MLVKFLRDARPEVLEHSLEPSVVLLVLLEDVEENGLEVLGDAGWEKFNALEVNALAVAVGPLDHVDVELLLIILG